MIRPLLQQQPTPNFDRPFLNTVKQSFYDLWHSPEALPYLLATFLAILFVIIVAILYNQLVRRNQRDKLPPGWFVDPEKIHEILEVSLDQRSKYELRFLPADPSRWAASCSLMDLNHETLTLEPPAYVEAGPSWIDREIECFFGVNEERGLISFYRFVSKVQSVGETVQGIPQIVVGFPRLLHNHQKRNFLRITPPTHYFLGVALWLDARLPKDDHELPSADLSRWGRPLFTYIPDKQSNPIKIDNISAGGLRLGIQRWAVRGRDIELRLADRIVVLLDLYDPEAERKKRFWMRCRVQNIQEDYDTKDLEIGVQFITVGRMSEDGDRQVHWHPVIPEQGVGPLEAWVMQRHLELFREKGID